MQVPSWQFLLFAIAGAVAFNGGRAPWWREAVWLVLNLAFVWSLAPTVWPLLPLFGFLALGYACIEAHRRGIRIAPIVLVLAVFIWLKRYGFVPHQILLPPGIMLIGLSYIFFRVMHLVIDAGVGDERRVGVVRYLNFTLNFPAFISGPIQRLEDYEANDSLSLTLLDIGVAVWRMMLGAFKVLVLSAVLHAWQTALIAGLRLDPHPVPTTAGIVVLYALFLYANFSGYTDFVIGIARLYRLRLPENFDQPFISGNFIEFWSRWHISLSQWLRSYVFNTLLMGWMRRYKSARGKQYPSIVAFFVTFFLVGAWHGQTSEFLFFGLLQGGGVAGNRLYQVWMTKRLSPAGYEGLCRNPLYRALTRGVTFTWFACTLLWFWATWAEIGNLAARIGAQGCVLAAIITMACASAVLSVPDLFGASTGAALRSRYTRTAFTSVMVLALAAGALVLNMSSPEIVYKRF
ncbi:MAG TPA: MBOAT family O-acyltransferase [Rhodopila sp.]|nr:MBOAT family O-acyltransferase [Rhodopila sp.]